MEASMLWLACRVLGMVLSSHRPSEPMFRPMLVMLFRCSLATSQTMSQISRSLMRTAVRCGSFSFLSSLDSYMNTNGMRAAKMVIGVITFPTWRRVKKYTILSSRPRGFSMGGRYVAMCRTPFGLSGGPRSAGHLYGKERHVTGGRHASRCSGFRGSLPGLRAVGAGGSAHPLCGPFAGHLAGGDVEPVPGVDRGDVGDQGGQRWLAVVLGGLVPDFAGHRVGPVGQPGGGLGQGQGGPLGFGEVGGVPPGRQGGQALVGLAGLLGRAGVHIEADGAAVDLAGPQARQVDRRVWQAGLASRLVCRLPERLQGLQGAGHGHR